eukprot:TRINITY_DN17055_c0_g1_i1.p1 TRINITY_DN17055_c0_g1~~TRINITY_DN17055_c0_g1_i1.p1  ORF type:complete len:1486 (-),score=344.05 TRINITY_DN17055_c0_g1_i1:247-4704(-)
MSAPLLQNGDGAMAEETSPPEPAADERVLFPTSDVFFFCANWILDKGVRYSSSLSEKDAISQRPEEVAQTARNLLDAAWQRRIARGKPSLLWSVLDISPALMIPGSLMHLLEIGFIYVSPPLIEYLCEYVDSDNKDPTLGMLAATLFCLTPVMQCLLSSHFILRMRRFGMRIQAATACMVFEKVLRLSQTASVEYGAGSLVNIMQVDTFRFAFFFFWLSFLWSMPLMLIVGLGLLYNILGVAAFTPVVIMLALSPLNSFLVGKLMNFSRQVNKDRDSRIKVLTEVLHASRLVKMLAWEGQIKDLVAEQRNNEMKSVAKFKVFDVINGLMWQGVPALLPLATIGTYVLMGGELKPGKVFAALALLDQIRTPMNLIPQAVQVVVQVKIGIDRIEKLLLAQEVNKLSLADLGSADVTASTAPPAYMRHSGRDTEVLESDRGLPVISTQATAPAVSMSGVALRWAVAPESAAANATSQGCQARCKSAVSNCWPFRSRADARAPLLEGQNDMSMVTVTDAAPIVRPMNLRVSTLEIMRGKLVFVVGPVGAGKSTLVAGLLNEVPLVSGRVEIHGPVAYCAQVPWILYGTLKENVLFGSDYEESRFNEVIAKCALEADLKELRDGVDTVIGERGINLSGGQKARVGLARAAYKHSSNSIYILDDPLSAVDMHVAGHLMEECIGSEKGLLKHTTRILISHQVQFLDKADLVLVLKDGEVTACRPPSEFSKEELEGIGVSSSGAPGSAPSSAAPTPTAGAKKTMKGPSLIRTISGASDVEAVMDSAATAGCTEWLATLKPSSAAVSEMELGAPRLHPLNRRRQMLLPPTLLRSISAGPVEDCELPATAPVLLRARSAEVRGSESAMLEVGDAFPDAIAEGDEAAATDGQQPTAPANEAAPANNNEEEEKEVGALDLKVWCAYVRTMGACVAAVLGSAYLLTNITQLVATFYLAGWSKEEDPPKEETLKSLSIYAALSWSQVGFLGARMLIFRWTSIRVSKVLHTQSLWAVLRAPMAWLDTTPTGRIVNRFSQDMQRLDMELQGTLSAFVDTNVNLVIAVIVVSAYVPIVLVVIIPLMYLYNKVQHRFRSTARELQRLSSRSKSPIFQGLDEAIVGVASIRAFEEEVHFIRRNADRVSLNTKLDCNIMACNRWLSLRLRVLGSIPVCAIAYYVTLQSQLHLAGVAMTGATAGLVLRYALQLTGAMEGLLQSLTQTELCLVAVERITGYTKLEPEPELALPDDDTRARGWPQSGEIKFEEVVMRYRPDLPRVLNGVSFTVKGGTGVGVVGRTGAGKSSLLQALFRMCPYESGRVLIDGIDVTSIGLHTLRRRLAIIPQDPVGFTGTVRFNLDPFQESTDEAMWKELRKVQLEEFFAQKSEGLDYHLSAGGENLSVGQRQLVCAARAFLRNCRILILDEATASVDFKTDNLIQDVLRNEIETRKLTTLTIAHRINTIMGADNVLVMERGVAAEFGPPKKLAKDSSSKFYTFVHPKK